jgi:hypothetical protein
MLPAIRLASSFVYFLSCLCPPNRAGAVSVATYTAKLSMMTRKNDMP